MANEPDTTPIHDLYAQRFAVDLETNRKEQDVTSAQIAELDARLKQLKADETWLFGMQGTLPPASDEAAAAADGTGEGHVPAQPVRTPAIVTAALSAATVGTPAGEAVPRPRRARKTTDGAAVAKKTARPKKAAPAAAASSASSASGTATKTAARKPAATTTATTAKADTVNKVAKVAKVAKAAKADPAKKASPAPATKTEPPLRELVLALLVGAAEPRMVSEITTAMAQAHPGRPASTQVVRNTLETLAKKGVLDKENKQGSVMYAAATAARPAANAPAADAAATPATADAKAAARS